MKATILDTITGLTGSIDGPRSFEWAEDGWSCDCNRDLWNVTNHEDECGTNRFLVIEAEMNDPEDYQYTLHELNECYPVELLKKYGLISTTKECEDCEGSGVRSFLGYDNLEKCHDCGGIGHVDSVI